MTSRHESSYPAQTRAERIANSQDLLTELLLRLPPKSLLRFKCVSKRWLSLISNPQFCCRHARLNPSFPVSTLFFKHAVTATPELHYIPLDAPRARLKPRSLAFLGAPYVKILQSCNGLLLCSSSSQLNGFESIAYHVLNPTTNQFTTLALPDGLRSEDVLGINLAFDPSQSVAYKIICVHVSAASVCKYQIHIYSSEAGAWRPSGNPFTARDWAVFSHGVFWNGAIHWFRFLYFDVDQECMKKLEDTPRFGRDDMMYCRFIGESHGHLHLLVNYGSNVTQFDVFEMERDHSRWVLTYLVDLETLPIPLSELILNYDPGFSDDHSTIANFFVLGIVRRKKEEDSMIILSLPGKVIAYYPKDNSTKKLCDLMPCQTEDFTFHTHVNVYEHIETLCCV